MVSTSKQHSFDYFKIKLVAACILLFSAEIINNFFNASCIIVFKPNVLPLTFFWFVCLRSAQTKHTKHSWQIINHKY